jgi:hypothetical protein
LLRFFWIADTFFLKPNATATEPMPLETVARPGMVEATAVHLSSSGAA